jgi:CcmD family protein
MLDALPIAAPALPLDEAGKYVAAAYIVFVVLILVYVAIMAAKLQRIERELRELAGFAEQRKASQGPRDRAEAPSHNPQVEAVAEELHR